jgi:hypothetical protein
MVKRHKGGIGTQEVAMSASLMAIVDEEDDHYVWVVCPLELELPDMWVFRKGSAALVALAVKLNIDGRITISDTKMRSTWIVDDDKYKPVAMLCRREVLAPEGIINVPVSKGY